MGGERQEDAVHTIPLLADTASEKGPDSVRRKVVTDVQLYLDDVQLDECVVHILVSNVVGQGR